MGLCDTRSLSCGADDMNSVKKKFLCGGCKKPFATLLAVRDHAAIKHHKSGVRIYECVETIPAKTDDDESFAERAVAASLAIAMGEHTDDEWLLP